MKKLLGILVLGLLWCNVGFAECIEGDCNNGYGTFTWTDGAKYVGEFKDGLQHGQGTFTYSDGSVVKGIWENSKLVELKKRSYEKPLIMKMEMAPVRLDFICYNSCKERNDDAFCRLKCSIQ